nr:MAG TPA: hypothetical protein [Caudoviricetes sp.]
MKISRARETELLAPTLSRCTFSLKNVKNLKGGAI